MRKATSVVLACACAALLWGAGRRNRSLVALRDRYRLEMGATLENSPPLVVFTTVVLGGFRGLLADVLWLRAAYLQDQGEFFELAQLADWITKLEPRQSEVWSFHAWNLAYNISVMMGDYEERWRWVRRGIALIRDKGLRYNASDPKLYGELGWLFQHKIGRDYDDAGLHYRRRWAAAMAQALSADGARPAAHDARSAARCRRYGLLPAVMASVDRDYGPLDWRLPETHAVYWAYRGRGVAGERGCLSCDRVLYQCMAELFFSGRLLYEPDRGTYLRAPAPALLGPAVRAFETAAAQHGAETVQTAFANFMANAVMALHGDGDTAAADRLLADMRRRWPGTAVESDSAEFVERRLRHLAHQAPAGHVMSVVHDTLVRALQWRALGEEGRAARCEDQAQRLWRTCAAAHAGAKNEDAGLLPLSELGSLAREHMASRLSPERMQRLGS